MSGDLDARERLLVTAERETRGRTLDGSGSTAHWWVRVRYDDLIAALGPGPSADAAK